MSPNDETSLPLTMIARRGFIARCWTGEARLWQAFWIVGFVGKFLVLGAIFLVAAWFYSASKSSLVSDSFAIPAFIGYVIFVAVSVWRCAPNAKHQALSALAKVWVIFYVLAMTALLLRAALIHH